jgi:integrase
MLAYDLATRPSETLALWWDDIDLTTGEVLINATVVRAKMRVWQIRRAIDEFALTEDDITTLGTAPDMTDDALVTVTYRQPFGKTRESKGSLIVSDPTLTMLGRRKGAAQPTQRLVMPNQRGKLMSSSTMSQAWQRVVAGTELEWSTPRTLRSTRVTRVAEKHGMAAARRMLRHQENSRVTAAHYVPRNESAVSFSDAL